MLVCTPVYKRL